MTLRQSLKDPHLYNLGNGYWRYKGLWHYQWAWEFLRRNSDYRAFYPQCIKAYERVVKESEQSKKFQAYWPEFSETKEYEILKKEFGLICPENPRRHGRRISAEIWAPEHFLNIIVMHPNESVYAPNHTVLLSFDTRRPFEFLMAETAEILRQAECREHVTHIYPEQFEEYLQTYDQCIALHRDLGRKPTNYEVAKALYPGEWDDFIAEYGYEDNSALNNEFAARYAHKIKKARDYVEGKRYLDLMRWRPYEENFKP